MAQAPPADRDVFLLWQIEELLQGQARAETAIGALVPLLEQILDLLAQQQTPPQAPIAPVEALYPSLETDPEDEVPRADVPAVVVPPPRPPARQGWRRLLPRRSTQILVALAVVLVGALPWYRINLTSSAPRGVWLRAAVPAVVARGSWVTLPVPASVRMLAPRWLPLLKPVAAVAGDQVCVREATLYVRGITYGAVASQVYGQSIPHLGDGCLTVGQGQVFVASTVPQSLDSRYFGPVPVAALTAQATPWLVWRGQ